MTLQRTACASNSSHHANWDVYDVVDLVIWCQRLCKCDVVNFASVIWWQQPADGFDNVFAVVLEFVNGCPMLEPCVGVGPLDDYGCQSSHTLYAAVTRPRSGSMKCRR